MGAEAVEKIFDELEQMIRRAREEVDALENGQILHLTVSGWIRREGNGYRVDVWRGHEAGKTIEDYMALVDENRTFLEMYSKATTPTKVLILLRAYGKGATESEIGETVGLRGGALHYHLRDLIYLGLLERTARGVYRTTKYGTFVILAAFSAIHKFRRSLEAEE